MPDPVLPLQDLTQQISQREAELDRLRREYEARQAQLADLARRKEQLRGQLKQVDADIQAVKQGNPTGETVSSVAAPLPALEGQTSLPQLLVNLVRKAQQPMTVPQLVDAVIRLEFPTTSRHVPAMIRTRVKELVKKGLLRPAKGQPGFVPGRRIPEAARSGSKSGADNRPQPAKNGRGATSKKPAAKNQAGAGTEQPPLRVVLTRLLTKSRRPLKTRALTEQVLATGYQTKSKNLFDVIRVALAKMDNVENVPGKGYRLRR
jgi:hypothetical protein